MNIEIQEAIISDLDFIITQILRNSKKGHFNPEYTQNPLAINGLKDQIKSTIFNNIMTIYTHEVIPSKLFILKNKKKSIGFLWTRYRYTNKYEIYMLSIIPKERNKGYCQKLLNFAIANISNSSDYIYVDLYPKSEIMKQIILKKEFQQDGMNQGNFERFCLKA